MPVGTNISDTVALTIDVGSSNDHSGSDDDSFSIQLVNSSWCGLLAALTLLLEAR